MINENVFGMPDDESDAEWFECTDPNCTLCLEEARLDSLANEWA